MAMAGDALEEIVPGRAWGARQALRFGPIGLTTRMTVLRLGDGGLWVHSPVTPTPERIAAIRALGPVRHVVAPNLSHHLFFGEFLQAFPDARGYLAPGLAAKRPDLARWPTLPAAEAAPWAGELSSTFIAGLPQIDETVWFHRPTGTLVVTDLLFNFGADTRGLGRLAARLLGVYRRPGMSRTMRWLVKDRAAFRRSVEPLLELDVRRIVPAHGDVVSDDARGALARAFDWLSH